MPEDHIKTYLAEIDARASQQGENRAKIANATPLSETALRKLDSALKRTTAFMKKLKNIGAAQQTAILADLEKINLSKFVEEIATSVAEAKIKVSDLPAVVTICVRLCCLYAEFSPLLLSEFKRVLPTKRSDKIANPSKLRVDIRLLGELCLHGIFGKEGVQLLGSVISYLTLTDKTEHLNIPILLSFCKTLGVDILGLHAYSIQKEAEECSIELTIPSILPSEQKKIFAGLLLDYRKSLVDHINKELSEMNRLLRSVKRQTRTRGDATAEDRTKLEETRGRYEKQLQSGVSLSEALGVEMETMEEEQSEDEEEEISAQQMGRALQEGTLSVWPDEDTRQFYETRMELRQMVPAILFQESEKRTLEPVGGKIEDVDVTGLEAIPEREEEQMESPSEGEEEEMGSNVDLTDIVSKPIVMKAEGGKLSGQELKLMMNAFLEQLPWLINRDLIDKAALDFVTNLNTKNNRKKLCQMMLEQHRDRLDLLPFYSRLIATLEPVMPDLALEVCHALIEQFKFTVQNKSKLRVDWKVRCCRFISELVKFGVIPKGEALTCLRMVLFDFRGHNIDMCCAMVDSMGPFLYRSTDSHGKMKVLLEVMVKKRERLSDPRQQMLIDNAYFTCVPPEQDESPRFKRPVMHEFIRNLVITLTRFRVELVSRCLRKLDWSDPLITDYGLRILSSPWIVKYGNIPYLASVVSTLSTYHDWIGVHILDNVLEEIRMSLEMPTSSVNQRALLAVVYLGQLYNYSVCDSPVIFKTLYQLITCGALDPLFDDWSNLMRLVLVNELLFTCGEYFNGGSAKKKLDCFLVFFYRYYVAKLDSHEARNVSFPKEVAYQVEEMSDYVRKGIKIPKTMAEAQRAVEEMQDLYRDVVAMTLDGEERNDEEPEDEEEEAPRSFDHRKQLETIGEEEHSSCEEQVSSCYDDNEDVHVHTNHVVLPEDEQFIRQLDQMIAETMQSRPSNAVAPIAEIVVPTSARQKFHRAVAFAENSSNAAGGSNECHGIRMAILTKGKGNKPVLKPISMAAPSGLAESWNAQMERERNERNVHKRITLTMNERMMADELCEYDGGRNV